MSTRLCLICRRRRDDPLHGDTERGGLAHDTEPRIEQHPYDAGERRRVVRRMVDRIRVLEDAERRVGADRGP